jgi:hypothetical protein
LCRRIQCIHLAAELEVECFEVFYLVRGDNKEPGVVCIDVGPRYGRLVFGEEVIGSLWVIKMKKNKSEDIQVVPVSTILATESFMTRIDP